MPNAAAVPPRTRRPRTAAGAIPPQIALDVARVTTCTTWLADTLHCCDRARAREVCAELLPALGGHLSAPLDDVVIATLTGYATAHLAEHARTDEVDPTALWAWLGPEAVTAGLRGAYESATAAATLDETIADAVAAGLDGELITWEVITRESVRHEGLIHKECNRLARTLPDRGPEDLKGYGWAGLRVALRNFDPALGYAFSTYACPKINGAIRDGVRAESPIPKRLTTFVRKVSQAEEKLTQILGRTPSYAEIAEFLDESIEAMSLLPRLSPTASIEEMSNPWGDKAREPACMVDRSAPEDEVVISLRNEALRAAVSALPEDESTAVRLLMLEEVPVGEAAALVGVEPRQLRMRKLRGMKALAPVMAAWLDENATV